MTWLLDRVGQWHDDKTKVNVPLSRYMGMSEELYARWATKQPKYVLGIDEVGLGALAGPLVVGGVVAPFDWTHRLLCDSKATDDENERAAILRELHESPGAVYFTHRTSQEEIDRGGIRRAHLASFRSVIDTVLAKYPDTLVVIDGILRVNGIDHVALPKADSFVPQVMAASLVAKVARDTEMIKFGKEYPGYDFAKNKGYGSKKHYEGLNKLGLCPLHRRSYKLKLVIEPGDTSP